MRVDGADHQVLRHEGVEDGRQRPGLEVRADNERRKVGEPQPALRRDAERVAIVRAQSSMDCHMPRGAVPSYETPVAARGEIAVEKAKVGF